MFEVLGSGLLGAFLVFIFDLVFWRNRQKCSRVNGNLRALYAEIAYCGKLAQGFLDDDVKAPLYRLPHIVYENSLPVLFSEGAVDEDQTAAWLLFYQVVSTLNRGLDLADRRRIEGDSEALRQEVERNNMKARKISASDGDIYQRALSMADKEYHWWQV